MPPVIVVCPSVRSSLCLTACLPPTGDLEYFQPKPVPNVPAHSASQRGFTFFPFLFFWPCFGSGIHFGSFSSPCQAHHVAPRRISSPEHRHSMALWSSRFCGNLLEPYASLKHFLFAIRDTDTCSMFIQRDSNAICIPNRAWPMRKMFEKPSIAVGFI